ncbi:MAG: SIS domain-containing protein, partial [Actinobacteria bacterium]|nr:SIS domain-containing protein [Actinomycetota bacterium]
VLDSSTLVVGISQSGATADTLAAVGYARKQKAKVIAITHVVGSSITREADAVLYTHAGPEVGVAATKTLTTQMTALWLLALWMAQTLGTRYPAETKELLDHLNRIPAQVESVLVDTGAIVALAEKYKQATTFLFIGRGVGFPVAMEGALKMKEISYLHAEGFAAGEMKHGPIALLEDGVPVVGVATRSHVKAKMFSNMQEAKARGAEVIALVCEDDDSADALFSHVIRVPATPDLLSPAVDVVPLQLLAYHVAKKRGLDPDKPRNLAKSVTVE